MSDMIEKHHKQCHSGCHSTPCLKVQEQPDIQNQVSVQIHFIFSFTTKGRL